MKRLFALLTALVLLTLSTSALADSFWTMANNYDSLFRITNDTSRGVAFIDTRALLKVKDLSFTHPNESNDYYSYVYNDFVVIDPNTANAYPVWRIWVSYIAKQPFRINAVSFIFDGKKYTFTNVYSSDFVSTRDNGDYNQEVMIKLGNGNIEFTAALETYIKQLKQLNPDDMQDAIVRNGKITMILHGPNDVTIDLTSRFLLDFEMMRLIFTDGNASSYLNKATDPTPLTVSPAR